MPFEYWICAAMTAISAYVSLGYSITGLRAAVGDEARTSSMYAFARGLALAVAATVGLFVGEESFVAAVAVAMILVQGCDAMIGAIIKDPLKTYGPAGTAIANLAALIWMIS